MVAEGSPLAMLKCLSWNVQSLQNKCAEVMEHVQDYEADVVFLSETWMQSNNNEITAMVKSYGYTLLHNRRCNRDKVHGGGVGIMLKTSMSHKHISSKSFSSFEHTIVKVRLKGNTNFTMISIYRLLSIPINVFFGDFTKLLEMLSASNEVYVLVGDINIHLDTDDSNALHIKEIFNMFNLKQYVHSPTHTLGHTIDCVLAGSDYPQINGLICDDVKLSDHFILSFEVNISVSKSEYETITYQDTKIIE